MGNSETVNLKSGLSRIQEVVLYETFQLGFKWQTFGGLNEWSLVRGGSTCSPWANPDFGTNSRDKG